MKLKLGNTILNQQVLRNLFWIFLFIGIFIGASIAFREDGKRPISIPLALPFILIITKLSRGIRQEIGSERESHTGEE